MSANRNLQSNAWTSMIRAFDGGKTIEKKKPEPRLSNSERSRWLFDQLEDIHRTYLSGTPKIAGAIAQLMQLANEDKLTIPAKNHRTPVFQRSSIFVQIGSLFDELFCDMFPEGSLTRSKLKQLGVPLPIGMHLKSREDLLHVAKQIQTTAEYLEEYLHFFQLKNDGFSLMYLHGESLSAVAEVLNAVRNVLPNIGLNWCQLCFRRCDPSLKCCLSHISSKNKENDSNYRRGRLVRRRLDSQTLEAWNRYFAIRKAFGESINLISYPEDVPNFFSLDSKFLTVDPQIKILHDMSMQKEAWVSVCNRWEYILQAEYPKVSSMCKKRPAEFGRWSDFAEYLLDILGDSEETTRNPFWMLNILCNSEDWFRCENERQDRRKTDTARKILELFEKGITKPQEIADLIGKSKTIVCKVLARERKKRK